MNSHASNYPQPDWRGDYPPGYQGYPRQMYKRPRGISGLEILGIAALAVVVVGGIIMAPDIARYIRIHNM